MKVRGIYCINSKCVSYFENNCMKILETDTVNIDEEGKCSDFRQGQYIGYQSNSELNGMEKCKTEECEFNLKGNCINCDDLHNSEENDCISYVSKNEN